MVVVLCWREEGTGEGLVRRWQGDEHELSPRPDVQMVWRDAEISSVSGGDVKLTPQRVNVFLLEVDTSVLHQMIPRRGVRTVGPNEKVKGNFDLRRSVGCIGASTFARNPPLKPSFVGKEIGTGQLVIEEQLHIGRLL